LSVERSGFETSEIRDYRQRDFASIVALDRECFEPGIAYSEAEMRRFLALTTRVALVAHEETGLAGFCIGYRSPPRTARILTLDVRASNRRTGLGRRLLQQTVDRMVAAGATETALEVDVRNQSAIRFYEGLRFERVGRLADYYGPGRDAFEMLRRERPDSGP
jgi:ribosomal-protein-alanine N-acetyltransferase